MSSQSKSRSRACVEGFADFGENVAVVDNVWSYHDQETHPTTWLHENTLVFELQLNWIFWVFGRVLQCWGRIWSEKKMITTKPQKLKKDSKGEWKEAGGINYWSGEHTLVPQCSPMNNFLHPVSFETFKCASTKCNSIGLDLHSCYKYNNFKVATWLNIGVLHSEGYD